VSDTGQDTPVGREQGPAARSDEDRELAARLVAEASEKGLDLVGPDGVLTGLTKRVLEAGLEAELTEHLGYDKHAVEGRGGGNSRNGTRPKTVLTEVGPVKLDVPRDRDSSFAPQLVKKRQRRLHGVDEMIISLTAKGLTTGEAQAQLAEVYGSDVRARTGSSAVRTAAASTPTGSAPSSASCARRPASGGCGCTTPGMRWPRSCSPPASASKW
jgi:putative transposase